MDILDDDDHLRAPDACREIPTRAACEAILIGQSVEPSVVRHSRKVAEVAHRIASALSLRGLALNLELVRAGALLHDVAKGMPEHAAAGAAILTSMGFPRVAAIVAAHTDLEPFASLDESAIVYLADKLVRGEETVTIDERFQPALIRCGNDALALCAVQGRMATAKAVAQAVEVRLEVSLASIVHEASGAPEAAEDLH
jgi:putative nucleotidyltransferase with HDIG domain